MATILNRQSLFSPLEWLPLAIETNFVSFLCPFFNYFSFRYRNFCSCQLPGILTKLIWVDKFYFQISLQFLSQIWCVLRHMQLIQSKCSQIIDYLPPLLSFCPNILTFMRKSLCRSSSHSFQTFCTDFVFIKFHSVCEAVAFFVLCIFHRLIFKTFSKSSLIVFSSLLIFSATLTKSLFLWFSFHIIFICFMAFTVCFVFFSH